MVFAPGLTTIRSTITRIFSFIETDWAAQATKLFSTKAVKATDGGWRFRIPTIKSHFLLGAATATMKRFAMMKCLTDGGGPISGWCNLGFPMVGLCVTQWSETNPYWICLYLRTADILVGLAAQRPTIGKWFHSLAPKAVQAFSRLGLLFGANPAPQLPR